MQSDILDGKPFPANQARSDSINKEIVQTQKRIEKIIAELKANSGK